MFNGKQYAHMGWRCGLVVDDDDDFVEPKKEVNTCMQSEPTCMCTLPSAGAPSSCVPSSKGW